MRKGKGPDPYLWLMDPDPGGQKTCGACGSGSPTLILIPQHMKPVKKERKRTPWGRQTWSRPQTLPEAFHRNKPFSSGKCQHNQYGTCQTQLNPSGDPVPLLPEHIKTSQKQGKDMDTLGQAKVKQASNSASSPRCILFILSLYCFSLEKYKTNWSKDHTETDTDGSAFKELRDSGFRRVKAEKHRPN